ncbi:MAG: signal recognition particle-docking protein FtsY [Cyanobium sp.]
MVFDWFKRAAVPQSPAPAPAAPEPPAAPESVAEPAAVREPAAELSSQGTAAAAGFESSPLSGAGTEPTPTGRTDSEAIAIGAAEAPGSGVPTAQPPAVGAVDQQALDWARQAYARLKAQQQEARTAAGPQPSPAAPILPAEVEQTAGSEQASEFAPAAIAEPSAVAEPVVGTEPAPALQVPEVAAQAPAAAELAEPQAAAAAPQVELSAPESPAAPGLSLLEQAAAQRQQRLQQLTAVAPSPQREPQPAAAAAATAPAPVESEPQLGEFDDTFTWSAEVLAAQGRQVEDMSLEEIDWLGRLRRGLEKTRRGFVTQLLENLGEDPLTPEVLDDLETTLLRADVGVQATDQVLDALRRRLNQEVVDPAEGLRFLKEQLRGLLEAPIAASATPLLVPQKDRLNVWLMVGVNGVGKTTTLGKLANLAVRSGYSCLIAAADTFRAAAVEQVSIWGQRSGVAVIANPSANADPAAVVYDAIGAARAKGTELVLVDTAGRLQTKHNLMEELTKVRRIIDKLAPEAVVESLLVLDASQGQNGLRQAMAFARVAGLTGVVITKLDGSARGGVALAVASEAGLPIRFIGAGEGIRDLRPFNSFEFVEALLAR